jgi:2-C-methyl-D-erythritol 4-phosphate cytidylyltransferase/2-C-methyl-D-erythritol 2,4-cyclodiphosphate synthase
MPKSVALVVAAGRGHRAGGEIPKQYMTLAGRPLLRRTVAAFAGHGEIDAVRVVINPDDRALYDAAVAGLTLLEPVAGGAERQDSVRNGLESLVEHGLDNVLIHDAARPFVTADLISRTLAALDHGPGAIAAVPLSDTLKRGDGMITETIPRDGLWRAQTPQAFHYDAILAAHRDAAGLSLTDDAAVAERAGLAVTLVPGGEDNFKVTTPEDFERAQRMLTEGAATEARVGTGFDAHRFGAGDHVMLCGARIAHDRGLVGHSDADVGIHAIVDALLGAIGAGDIGDHFPPADPRWAGADSTVFLAHARDLVERAGGVIGNVDVTLICERPRVGPHRAAMIACLAEVLAIAPDRVNVKATTTERLGFTGRGEGIAAQAVATVRIG